MIIGDHGLIGSVTLLGGGGNDCLSGGLGDDCIFGDTGNDTLLGEAGHDWMRGNEGADSMLGSIGFDTMFGDAGNDTMLGQSDDDVMFGGADADTISGATGNDIVFGDDGLVAYIDYMGGMHKTVGDGDPLLIGTFAGDGVAQTLDLIVTQVNGATDGNDSIDGGSGEDTVLGGAGNDEVYGDFAGSPLPAAAFAFTDLLIGDGGRIELNERRLASVTSIPGTTPAEAGNDTISGQGGSDLIIAGGGDDLVYGRTASGAPVEIPATSDDDLIIGDDGNFQASTVTFPGDPRPTTVFSSIATDITADAIATGGRDSLFGNDGDDIIFGGMDQDQLQGDTGNDVALGDNGEILFDSVGEFNLIHTTDSALATGGDDDVISGHAGADTLIGGSADDLVYGDKTLAGAAAASPGADVIIGDQGQLVYNSGTLQQIETTDTVEADGGVDTIEGNQASDTVLGGTFGDLLRGNEEGDVVLGDEGIVRYDVSAAEGIPGTGDDDPVTIDLVTTKSPTLGGNDTILGNAANDTALGGAGGDLILGDNDESSPGSGVFDSVEAAAGLDVLIGDQGQVLYLSGNLTRIEATDAVAADGGSDTIEGNDHADVILGGVAGDLLRGEAKHTSLQSAWGNEVLLGDEGSLRYDVSAAEGGDDDIATLDLVATGNATLGGDDTIHGNDGADTALGGAGDDLVYGDLYDGGSLTTDSAPGADVLLGDGGKLVYVNTALTLITSTDTAVGGSDTVEGNEKGDTILGGAEADLLLGEAADANLHLVVTSGGAGNDVILGDNGELGFALASDTLLGRPDVEAFLGGTNIVTLDASPATLDRITTIAPNDGGDDTIKGNGGSDSIFGGTARDLIYGDTSDTGPGPDGADGGDLILGDHAKIYPNINGAPPTGYFVNNNFFAIDTQASDDGNDDTAFGNAADDTMLGQQGDDVLFGGTENDDMIGGHNVVGGHDELDPMDGPLADAILNGDVLANNNPIDINNINDVMDGGGQQDMMAGDNAMMIRRATSANPRYQLLSSPLIYSIDTLSLDGLFSVDVGFTPNVTGADQLKPGGGAGRTLILIDHTEAIAHAAAMSAAAPRVFGNDAMAGGPHDDEMFGQLGDDIIQGDGAVQLQSPVVDEVFDPSPSADPSFTIRDDQSAPTFFTVLGDRLRFAITEAASDGDDYVEGNGGNDRIYGNLGQDDLIGGNSTIFGLNDATAAVFGLAGQNLRPDAADLIYGGAGNPVRLARNDYLGSGATAPAGDDANILMNERHARDADTILGDNANLFRLVSLVGAGPGTAYLQFAYDLSHPLEDRGASRIIPRAAKLVDYGFTYANATDPSSIQFSAIGLGDLVYGESGDDTVFGMAGDDVLLGNSEDDDLYGQQGHDWASGGTGVDGVIGDDGLIFSSRNATFAEPLYGIAGFIDGTPGKFDDPQLYLNAEITTPGDIQRSIINIAEELKKTVNLIGFELGGNDILFGGLNNDWMHAGAGDDAMLGGEALPLYYSGGATVNDLLKLQQAAPDQPGPAAQPDPAWYAIAPYNPGDILRYEGNNPGEQEFALYDEFNPRRKIMLDVAGQAVETAAAAVYDFLLNFSHSEGPLGFAYSGDSLPLPTDGDDRLFGDLDHDWMVGGTGRDNMYGGRGDDLINMDDNHDSGAADPNGNPKTSTTDPLDNTNPDEFQAYSDQVYGGGGRDVAILNTGADRAMDWVGEYNSFIVPFSPFGAFHISRNLQPFTPQFLYALSRSDGADTTAPDGARYVAQKQADVRTDDPFLVPARNGEPFGELGLVLQTDRDWHEQTGSPNDPQPGNFNGKREIMRRELFTDSGAATLPFAVDEGTAQVLDGTYNTAPTALGGEFVSLYHLDAVQPPYLEIMVTVNIDKATAGWKANGYVIFDYQSPTDFKFAGIDSGLDKIRIGHRTESGWVIDTQTNMQLGEGKNYNLMVVLHGTVASIFVGNNAGPSFDFNEPLNDFGMIGLGSDSSRTRFDDWQVQKLPPVWTFTFLDNFDDGTLGSLSAQTGAWSPSMGRLIGTSTAEDRALALRSLGVAPTSRLELQTHIQTSGFAGIVFDYYGPEDFKFAAIDAAGGRVVIGHHTSRGWVIDSSAPISINPAGHTFNVTLIGSSASVMLDGLAVTGFVFNSLLNDGGVGLVARSGSASFDEFRVRGDDPAFSSDGSVAMTADSAPTRSRTANKSLTQPRLNRLLQAAADFWSRHGGASIDVQQLQVQIADLPGLELASVSGDVITIDSNAAGHGWFVDATPRNSKEFRRRGDDGSRLAKRGRPAANRMDLLTVLTHELGHVLGLEHSESGDVMDEVLSAGERRMVSGHVGPWVDLLAEAEQPLGIFFENGKLKRRRSS